jgi:hypothetical protein
MFRRCTSQVRKHCLDAGTPQVAMIRTFIVDSDELFTAVKVQLNTPGICGGLYVKPLLNYMESIIQLILNIQQR